MQHHDMVYCVMVHCKVTAIGQRKDGTISCSQSISFDAITAFRGKNLHFVMSGLKLLSTTVEGHAFPEPSEIA